MYRNSKPQTPFRVITRGSLQHVVEEYRGSRGRWSDYQDWEQVARCTSRQLAEQVYTRRMVAYIEEVLQ